MSCHINRLTTHVITLWRVHVTSLTTSVSTIRFLIEIMVILNAIKLHFKGSFDQPTLTLVVISMKFMTFADGSFLKFYMKLLLVINSLYLKQTHIMLLKPILLHLPVSTSYFTEGNLKFKLPFFLKFYSKKTIKGHGMIWAGSPFPNAPPPPPTRLMR